MGEGKVDRSDGTSLELDLVRFRRFLFRVGFFLVDAVIVDFAFWIIILRSKLNLRRILNGILTHPTNHLLRYIQVHPISKLQLLQAPQHNPHLINAQKLLILKHLKNPLLNHLIKRQPQLHNRIQTLHLLVGTQLLPHIVYPEDKLLHPPVHHPGVVRGPHPQVGLPLGLHVEGQHVEGLAQDVGGEAHLVVMHVVQNLVGVDARLDGQDQFLALEVVLLGVR